MSHPLSDERSLAQLLLRPDCHTPLLPFVRLATPRVLRPHQDTERDRDAEQVVRYEQGTPLVLETRKHIVTTSRYRPGPRLLPDTFAPTSPLLPRQVARSAYQQPWKLQRKHTAAFHTCWRTVASSPLPGRPPRRDIRRNPWPTRIWWSQASSPIRPSEDGSPGVALRGNGTRMIRAGSPRPSRRTTSRNQTQIGLGQVSKKPSGS